MIMQEAERLDWQSPGFVHDMRSGGDKSIIVMTYTDDFAGLIIPPKVWKRNPPRNQPPQADPGAELKMEQISSQRLGVLTCRVTL
jgi:hypothetical protein